MTASEECIGTLLKIDAFGAHALSQPVILIEANACCRNDLRRRHETDSIPLTEVSV